MPGGVWYAEAQKESNLPMTRSTGITLVEVLIALTILSTLLLPIGMFLVEYLRGSDSLGDFHQVMNLLEEKMEVALAQPFHRLPVGTSENVRLAGEARDPGDVLDLRPVEVGRNLVRFSLEVEMVPVEFSAILNPRNGTMDRRRVEDGLKRLTLVGTWGDKNQHRLDLVAFKADL